jgi:hypothetical protein
MIVDCFSFFNEYDVLEGRLEYLYATVDYFVIIESDRAHNGSPKPFNFANNVARYEKYMDKILYFPYVSKTVEHYLKQAVVDPTFSPSMLMDHAQRNHMAHALKLFGPEVFVMISDLDEIPSHRAINYATLNLRVNMPAIGLVQDMIYYNLKKLGLNSRIWPAATIIFGVIFLSFLPEILGFPDIMPGLVYSMAYAISTYYAGKYVMENPVIDHEKSEGKFFGGGRVALVIIVNIFIILALFALGLILTDLEGFKDFLNE